ncbi:hypothetical protein LCGC14_1911270, partial [marine sediment metagenome]
MPDNRIDAAVASDLTNVVKDYSVDTQETDGVSEQKETIQTYEKWPQYLAYWKTIPEFKTAINSFATWVVGRGWTASNRDVVILDKITGWGEDNFQQILW